MLKKILTAFALLALSAVATAADGEKAVRDAIHSMLPMAIIDQVVKSDLPGFYEVIISGQIVYVTEDGKYLLQGKLYDVPQKKDLTSARVAVMREQALAKLPESKEMIFAPPNPKHTVTVFTDVDCPYCRQFHKQITEYNRLGIAVHYVLYPLDIHPGADKKAAAVWCSKDRKRMICFPMTAVQTIHIRLFPVCFGFGGAKIISLLSGQFRQRLFAPNGAPCGAPPFLLRDLSPSALQEGVRGGNVDDLSADDHFIETGQIRLHDLIDGRHRQHRMDASPPYRRLSRR